MLTTCAFHSHMHHICVSFWKLEKLLVTSAILYQVSGDLITTNTTAVEIAGPCARLYYP